jgi:hypothetical protein
VDFDKNFDKNFKKITAAKKSFYNFNVSGKKTNSATVLQYCI